MEWFIIRNPGSGLVLDATETIQVKLAKYNPQSKYQLWKKGPNQSLQCKGHGSNQVLDLHVDDFKRDGWGKLYLHPTHHGQNQQWILGGNVITCKHAQLRIDVHGGSKHINAKVGCFPAHNGDNQKWSIERPFKESLEFKVTSVQNIQNNGRKKMLVLGNTGDGKSTLCNILSGYDPNHQSIFPVSWGPNSCTQETKFANVFFNGNKENPISLIDTIGWSDSGDLDGAKIIEELITKLKEACDHINLFVLVINGENPRITDTSIEMFKVFLGMFTASFLEQAVVVFTRWEMSSKSMKRRQTITGKTDDQRAREYLSQLTKTLGLPRDPDYLIINSLYDPLDEVENNQFEGTMSKLYQRLQRSPNIPTVNVEEVKTKNQELMQRLEKHKKEMEKINQEIKRKKQEMESQKAKDEQARKEREATEQALRDRLERLEKRRTADAQGPNANAFANSSGVHAEASVGEAWVGDPNLLGARGPSASAGVSLSRGVEVGAHAGEVTAAGFSARAGVKFGASDGQLHLGPVSTPCSIQ